MFCPSSSTSSRQGRVLAAVEAMAVVEALEALPQMETRMWLRHLMPQMETNPVFTGMAIVSLPLKT
jgi:hypothetical protein